MPKALVRKSVQASLGQQYEQVTLETAGRQPAAVVPKWIMRYQVPALPAVVIALPDGRFVACRSGNPQPIPAGADMEALLENAGRYFSARKDFEKNYTPKAYVEWRRTMLPFGSLAMRENCLIEAQYEKNPPRVRGASVEQLGRLMDCEADVVPFLTGSSESGRAAARTVMQSLGARAVPLVLPLLESDSADHRAAAHAVVVAALKNQVDPPNVRDAKYWKSAAPEDRRKVVEAVREWVRNKQPGSPQAALVATARNQKIPEPARRAAVMALAQWPECEPHLVDLMKENSMFLREAAGSLLRTPSKRNTVLPVLFDRIETGKSAERVACGEVAAHILRVMKMPGTLPKPDFWGTATEANQAKVLAEWRAWFATVK